MKPITGTESCYCWREERQVVERYTRKWVGGDLQLQLRHRKSLEVVITVLMIQRKLKKLKNINGVSGLDTIPQSRENREPAYLEQKSLRLQTDANT